MVERVQNMKQKQKLTSEIDKTFLFFLIPLFLSAIRYKCRVEGHSCISLGVAAREFIAGRNFYGVAIANQVSNSELSFS